MEKIKINHKPDLIQIFKNLPFGKDINKLKKLLQWITNQYNINILEINRIKQYDKTISEILNAIYKNIFDKIKDDFIIELKRTIRTINLNESKTMKRSELKQLIREVILEESNDGWNIILTGWPEMYRSKGKNLAFDCIVF